ncbi:MAG: FeoA family protein [Stygiobacter sp.]|jgi:Fe2+ transport system protein FeoA|uniref:FeoA family protein n=1 Tax=Stygiobacter electus TaxID=3032292 RepID=A0AAE3TBQ0_9BACT|nr:FeoA family protein [Stygiobacter electus]MDF1611070.1 FeoA family protein [Stygiobacter electus]
MDKTLDKISQGKFLKITKLPTGDIKSQLIRLGLSEGDKLKCTHKLPGGTIVVKKNRQEIAIGFDLAKKIKIHELNEL